MTRSSLGLGLGLALALVGCSGNGAHPDAATQDSPTADAPVGGFSVTSPAFAAGGAIPVAQTCAGANTSPQLAWTGAPAGTLSFAVVLSDVFFKPPLVHWVIYDIPADATGLPAHVENAYAPSNVPGAHQTASYDSQVRGYLGPCPSEAHDYDFTVYALLAPALPGATMQTTRDDAVPAITAHQLAHGTLRGTFTP